MPISEKEYNRGSLGNFLYECVRVCVRITLHHCRLLFASVYESWQVIRLEQHTYVRNIHHMILQNPHNKAFTPHLYL